METTGATMAPGHRQQFQINALVIHRARFFDLLGSTEQGGLVADPRRAATQCTTHASLPIPSARSLVTLP